MSLFHSRWDKTKAHLQAQFADHGFLRAMYRNFFELSSKDRTQKAYRSNHPSPFFLRHLKSKYSINTVISLRRADTTGQYRLEKDACDTLDIELINHPMSSRSFPNVEQVLEAKRILETAQYPILIHCKSGADRAGMMSVFYMHFVEGLPIKEAIKQLHMKYGHFRYADTGKLDVFFDTFLAFEKQNPEISFLDWLQNHYDKQALNEEFKAKGWANIVVNRILKRE